MKREKKGRVVKLLALSLAVMMCLGALAGCGDGKGGQEPEKKITVAAADIGGAVVAGTEGINTNADMSWSSEAYAANLPTLYSKLEADLLDDGFIAYDNTGATADEVDILVAKSEDDVDKLADALKLRAEKRAADFGGYKPEERAKAESPKICKADRYVMMAICEDTSAAEKAFVQVMQVAAAGEKPDPVGPAENEGSAE